MKLMRLLPAGLASKRGARLTLRAILFVIGYILSPLSFWNDAFVNVPIAYAVAALAANVLGRSIFPAVFLAAYNASNVAGLLLMHVAARGSVRLNARSIVELLVASLVYTLVATLLYDMLT